MGCSSSSESLDCASRKAPLESTEKKRFHVFLEGNGSKSGSKEKNFILIFTIIYKLNHNNKTEVTRKRIAADCRTSLNLVHQEVNLNLYFKQLKKTNIATEVEKV